MDYIVLQQEIHADRVIPEIFGPFESMEAAEQFANKMDDHPSNFNDDGHRLFNFFPRSLSDPATA